MNFWFHKSFARSVVITALMSVGITVSTAYALPFNDDMVHSRNANGDHLYYSTGQIMRGKPEGSVAVGSDAYHVTNKDEAATLTNPLKGDKRSEIHGKRLFQVNCSPCHGNIEADPYERGPVATKFAAPPAIFEEPYVTVRSDGYLYGVIHFGGMAVMPPLGWKLSPTEHWDIINYVRQVQQKKLHKNPSVK